MTNLELELAQRALEAAERQYWLATAQLVMSALLVIWFIGFAWLVLRKDGAR